MKSLNKQSLANQVYNALLKRILTGEVEEGERLVIDRLAKEFGISLIPVREALARLHAQGLVNYVANQGYHVTPPLQISDYVELFEARRAIEYGALHIGFHKVDAAFIEKLEDLNNRICEIDKQNAHDAFNAFVKLNEQFHLALVSLSDSPPLLKTYDKIGYTPNIGRRMYTKGVPDIANNIREHAAIISALKSGDERTALDALDDHISEGLKRFQQNARSA